MVNSPNITPEGCREHSVTIPAWVWTYLGSYEHFMLCGKIKKTLYIKYWDFFWIFLEVLTVKIYGDCPRYIIAVFLHDVELTGDLFDILNYIELSLKSY